jgi:hypothetical protein
VQVFGNYSNERCISDETEFEDASVHNLLSSRMLSRLEMCTLSSTLTFQRCSSRHITSVIVVRTSFEVSVEEQCVPTMFLGHSCTAVIRGHCCSVVCFNIVLRSLLPHLISLVSNNVFQQWGHCSYYPLVMRIVCLLVKLDRQTDRQRWVHKLFFAHARARRTTET